MTRRRRGPQLGFTLIELLVVMIVIAIITATAATRLTADPSAPVREEARRLALLVQSAQEQAVLEGRFYNVKLDPHGYRFLSLNEKGELEPLVDDPVLRERVFPDGIAVGEVVINDAHQSTTGEGILLTPVGAMPSFAIDLTYKTYSWRVQSRPDGTVIASTTDA